MKIKIAFLFTIFLLSFSASFAQGSQSQSKSQNDLESTPATIRYYYYPNLQAYYDSQSNLYLFRVNKQWISAESFPENYGGYSLYNNHRVKIDDYYGDDITELLAIHKVLYPYNSKGRLNKEDS